MLVAFRFVMQLVACRSRDGDLQLVLQTGWSYDDQSCCTHRYARAPLFVLETDGFDAAGLCEVFQCTRVGDGLAGLLLALIFIS